MNKEQEHSGGDKELALAQRKALSPDKLIVTSNNDDIELSEGELKAVAGGDSASPNLFKSCATGKHFNTATNVG